MNRDLLLQHLAQAERHVARGNVHISRQETLIAEMDRHGHDTIDARKLLVTLRTTQALHRQDVERLLRELEH
jgi:hypothetical protein